MDQSYYLQYASSKDDHWWFRARRDILRSTIDSLGLPADAKILEVGCGTGGNLAMLATYGHLQAVELDESAAQIASGRSIVDVGIGALPDQLGVSGTFDLVVALDVIEHIEDDAGALEALTELVGDDGHLLITVPALMSLWGHHDEVNHHWRRYNRKGLLASLRAAGLAVEHATYFNFILLPIVAASRFLERFKAPNTGQGISADLAIPTPVLNSALYRVFSVERFATRSRRLPLGVSLLAIARPARMSRSNEQAASSGQRAS